MPTLTLPALFAGFTLAKQAAGLRDTTLLMYRVAYESLLSTLPDDVLADCRKLNQEQLVAWAAGMRDLATATRDQRIAKVKAFCSWAAREGFLDGNPSTALKRPRKDWQPDPLPPDQVERLLDYARRGRNRDRNFALVCLFLDSGIRNTELCTLHRLDVNLRTGQIQVTGKGGKVRTVLVGKRARDALWRWLAVAPEGIDLLFCTETGRPFTREVMRRLVATIAHNAGLPGRVYPHRLRHTFAVLYLRNHGDPYSLQYLLGHDDMAVTREYVKLSKADMSDIYRSPLDALPDLPIPRKSRLG